MDVRWNWDGYATEMTVWLKINYSTFFIFIHAVCFSWWHLYPLLLCILFSRSVPLFKYVGNTVDCRRTRIYGLIIFQFKENNNRDYCGWFFAKPHRNCFQKYQYSRILVCELGNCSESLEFNCKIVCAW